MTETAVVNVVTRGESGVESTNCINRKHDRRSRAPTVVRVKGGEDIYAASVYLHRTEASLRFNEETLNFF